jgi:hypothetical protein
MGTLEMLDPTILTLDNLVSGWQATFDIFFGRSGTKIVSDSHSLASWSCNRIQSGDVGTESCMQSSDV